MNPDTFDLYCEYRLRSEDAECTALRLLLGGDDAERYEAAYQLSRANHHREGAGSAAA